MLQSDQLLGLQVQAETAGAAGQHIFSQGGAHHDLTLSMLVINCKHPQPSSPSPFICQVEKYQTEEKPFLCDDEDLDLNQLDEDIKEIVESVAERETKNTQFCKIQRLLTLIDKNMTLVMSLLLVIT